MHEARLEHLPGMESSTGKIQPQDQREGEKTEDC